MQVNAGLKLAILGLMLSLSAHGAGLEPRAKQEAPAMRAVDLQGQTRSLADYRGRVVLLNFWAT